MQYYEINICQVMIFKLCAAYNKREMMKICNQTRGKIASIIASARIIFAVGYNRNQMFII